MRRVETTNDAPDKSVHERLYEIWVEAVERGDRFPSEPVLSETLGVSRNQLREALVRMEERGLIRRRHGAGTTVNPGMRQLAARLDRRVDFSETLRQVGLEPEMEVLEAGITALDADTAAELGVVPGSNALRTVKRWRGSGRVVMAAVDLVPLQGLELRSFPDSSVSLFDLIAELFGAPLEWEICVPGAVRLDKVTAGWLEHPVGEAVMTLELLGISRDGRAVYKAFEHHIPGIVRSGFVRPGVPGP